MTVSEQIIQVLDSICEKFGLAVDWTAANVLPYLEQLCGRLVNYEIATSIVNIGIALMCFFTIMPLTVHWFKKADFDKYDLDFYQVAVVIGGIFSAIAGIALLIVIAIEVTDIATALTFPEKIIIDYIKEATSAT